MSKTQPSCNWGNERLWMVGLQAGEGSVSENIRLGGVVCLFLHFSHH